MKPPTTTKVWYGGHPVAMIVDAKLEDTRIYDTERMIPTQANVTLTVKMSRLASRSLYRAFGITPPPLIHHGQKPKARRKRKR